LSREDGVRKPVAHRTSISSVRTAFSRRRYRGLILFNMFVIPSEEKNFTFPTGVSANTTADIIATLNGSMTSPLTVTPATLQSVVLSPNNVSAGASTNGTVILNGEAPSGGASVSVSSSNTSAATVNPTTVTVSGGSTSASFAVSTIAGSTVQSPAIDATVKGLCGRKILLLTGESGARAGGKWGRSNRLLRIPVRLFPVRVQPAAWPVRFQMNA